MGIAECTARAPTLSAGHPARLAGHVFAIFLSELLYVIYLYSKYLYTCWVFVFLYIFLFVFIGYLLLFLLRIFICIQLTS